jgi:hypothetical protein
MPDVITTASSIAASYATDIVSREFAASLTANVGVRDFVWVETAEGAKTVKFGRSTAMIADEFDDEDGMVLGEYEPDSHSVTVGPVGLTTRVTDFASSLRPDTLVRVAAEHGKAVALKIDEDITSLFPSVTASINRHGASFRLVDWLSAIYTLNAAKVPQEGRIGIVSAKQYSDLLSDSQTTNSYAFQQAANTGQLPSPFGVGVFMTQNVPAANSDADMVGCMFHRQAFGLGTLRGVNVDVQRALAQHAATDIATSVYYGVALLDTNRAVKFVSQD